AERAEGHELHRMAGRAGLAIDLQPTLELALVVVAEGAGKRPLLLHRLLERIMRSAAFGFLGGERRCREAEPDADRGQTFEEKIHGQGSCLRRYVQCVASVARSPAGKAVPVCAAPV